MKWLNVFHKFYKIIMEIQVQGNLTTIHNMDFQRQPLELSYKKAICKNLQNSQENICARGSFLIKLQASTASAQWLTIPSIFGCRYRKK